MKKVLVVDDSATETHEISRIQYLVCRLLLEKKKPRRLKV